MNRIAKKRILIVLAVSGVLVAGTGGLYGWRRHRIEQHFQTLRVEGMAAAKANDYATAVRDLQPYVARYTNDADALAEFCRVRPKVISADRSHLRETMTALRYYVSLRPAAVEQRRELLKLYLTYNLNTEALDVAERLLPADPKNAELLSAKTQALARLRRNDEALVAAQQSAALDPTDTLIQQIRVELMKQKGVDDATILADVDALVAAHPDAQGLQMVRGQVLAQANRLEEARAALKKAAAMPAATPTETRALASLMDRVGMFDDSVALLVKLAEAGTGDDDASRDDSVSLARRLWERGDDDGFLKLAARRPALLVDHPDLLAIHGLTLRKTGQKEAGDAELARLREDQKNPLAKAWASVVGDGVTALTAATAKSQIDLISDALIDQPNDAYLLYFLGESYSRTGDSDLAIAYWQRAARSAPAWAVPLMRLSETLASRGSFDEAYNAAAAAVSRSQRLALQNYIQIWSAAIDGGQRQDGAACLALIDQVLAQVPNEGWLRVARATVLCQLGRVDEAKAAVGKMLADASVKFDQQTLLRLAALSRVHHLGGDDDLVGKLRTDFGITADGAMTDFFRTMLNAGKDAALAAFEKTRAGAPSPDDRAWMLTDARLRDFVRDPKADAAWRAVLAKFGDDVDVINAALNSTSAWRDRAGVDGLIDKLKKLSEERGLTWRLHRARWLIEGSTDEVPDVAAAQQAADLLTVVLASTPENVFARYWQARAQVRLGNRGTAVEQILAAGRLAPRSVPIALYAADILQKQGDLDRAREQLERISTQDMTDPMQSVLAAQLLAQQGRPQQAIEMLQQSQNLGTTEQNDLLLAMLFQRQGEYEKTEAIISRLLQQPTLANVAFAADFYRARGKTDVADQTLQKLYALQLDPGVREMTLADYQLRRGDLAQARKYGEAATVASPQNVAAWRGLLLAELQAGDVAAANDTLGRAVKALPADAYLADLRSPTTWPLIAQVKGEGFRLLAMRMAADPKDEPIRQALTLLQKADGKVTSTFVEDLRKLADRYPLSEPLQVVAADVLKGTGRFADAAAIATRGVQAFPTDAALPRLAAQVLLSGEQWSQAKAFAAIWRRQAGTDLLPPDLLAAIASQNMGDPTTAESLLRPYVSYALDRLDVHSDVLRSFAIALYSTGKSNEAEQVIQQAITKRPAFAAEWLGVAGGALPTRELVPWLQRIEPQLTDVPGRTLAARIWLQVAIRPDAPSDAMSTLRQRLAALVAEPTLDVDSLVVLAIISDQINDDAQAEPLYRRAMANDAAVPVVWNNLAMLLLGQRRQLDEAETIAAKAVKAAPEMSVFSDTLAQVLLAEKKYGLARDTIAQATKREPQSAPWRLTAAEIAAADGKADEAESLLNDIMNAPNAKQTLAAEELRRADALRQRLGLGRGTGAVN